MSVRDNFAKPNSEFMIDFSPYGRLTSFHNTSFLSCKYTPSI